jgi:hypothetical protein
VQDIRNRGAKPVDSNAFSGEPSVRFDEAALDERARKFLESRFCYVTHAVGEFQRER